MLRIGAGVRHAAFHKPVSGGPLGRLLSLVVRYIAHDPIRRRGTFCGSIAHADPASEWCAVAAALDATMVARSTRGERAIAAKDFFQGIMTTALADDELLTEGLGQPVSECACGVVGTAAGREVDDEANWFRGPGVLGRGPVAANNSQQSRECNCGTKKQMADRHRQNSPEFGDFARWIGRAHAFGARFSANCTSLRPIPWFSWAGLTKTKASSPVLLSG